MQVLIQQDFLDLEDSLAKVLPMGLRPEAFSLANGRLRLQTRAPLLGAITLLAKVQESSGELLLSQFDLEGGGLKKALLLMQIRQKLGRLDQKWSVFHIYGESEGDRVHIRWK